MNKIICVSIVLLACNNAFSQDPTEAFAITQPDQKVQHSLYQTIHFLDSRNDITSMGTVQTGAFNKKVNVVLKSSLGAQLISVLDALNDRDAGNGELLFQLRQFSFEETGGVMNEKGYCHLQASLYTREENRYRKLGEIDTAIFIKSMGDVTSALFTTASKTLTDFIAAYLAVSPGTPESYTYNELRHISDIEKRTIPLYSAAVLTDGVYKTFEAFKNQVPDYTGTIARFRKDRLLSVTALNKAGKKIKVGRKDIYAVVHDGVPFIAADYGYHRLEKTGDDFFFKARVRGQGNTANIIASGLVGGIGGLLGANEDAKTFFEMKIDHLTGSFIRIREIIF